MKDKIAKILLNTKNSELIIISGNEDSDAKLVCAYLALGKVLQKLNKNVDILISEKDYHKVEFVPGGDLYINDLEIYADIFIMVGSDDKTNLGVFEKHFDNAKTKINITNKKSGSICEFLYKLIKKMKVEIDITIAELLYAGIILDTRMLSENLSKDTLPIVSELVNVGINYTKIANEMIFKENRVL